MVLIDRSAALGKTIGQVADYAAMRTLAQTRVPADGDTILTLFDPTEAAPRELTPFDRGFLLSLYKGSALARPLVKTATMAGLISRALAAAAAK